MAMVLYAPVDRSINVIGIQQCPFYNPHRYVSLSCSSAGGLLGVSSHILLGLEWQHIKRLGPLKWLMTKYLSLSNQYHEYKTVLWTHSMLRYNETVVV